MKSDKIIFHIDVNSAFLSWEAVYRLKHKKESLDLRLIPSAVGGDKKKRHGIILAKSEPAKQYNVKTAETLEQALKKCPSLVIVPPRYDLYHKCSSAFIKILNDYSPIVEQYSIDEAYIDMSKNTYLYGSPITAAHLIKDRIHQELGFTVNIGIGPNKLLAKMASNFKKPNLVHTLFVNEIPKKMWPLPAGDLFFVGKATQKKLNTLGIHTIGELAQSDPAILISHFGKHGQLIYNYANGIDSASLHSKRPAYKGYGNSVTIDHDVTNSLEAKKILLSLCETICSRLRKDSVLIGVAAVSVKNCFLVHGSHQKTLMTPTNVVSELHHHICLLFDEYWDGSPIRQLGIQTSKITKDNYRQMNLFDMDFYIRQEHVEKSVNQIRKQFGNDSIMRACFLDNSIYHMSGGIPREKKNPDNDDR